MSAISAPTPERIELRPPTTRKVDICANCESEMQTATCGVCNHDVFSAPPAQSGSWSAGELTFVVRATSVVPAATEVLELEDLTPRLEQAVRPFARDFPATRACH